jgi:hypothetical protein
VTGQLKTTLTDSELREFFALMNECVQACRSALDHNRQWCADKWQEGLAPLVAGV